MTADIDPKRLMTAHDLAAIFGVSAPTILAWGLPVHGHGKSRNKLFDIRDAVSRTLQKALEKAGAKQAKGGTKEEEEVLLMRARREKLELEIATIKGDLIPAEVVEGVWSDQLGYFKSSINSMPAKVGREICERFGITDQVTVEHILTKGRDESLARMSEYDAGEYMRRAGASVARIKEELDAVEQAAIDQRPARKKRNGD